MEHVSGGVVDVPPYHQDVRYGMRKLCVLMERRDMIDPRAPESTYVIWMLGVRMVAMTQVCASEGRETTLPLLARQGRM